MQRCRTCQVDKPLSEFYLTPAGNPRKECKVCVCARVKQHYRKDPTKHKNTVLKINYGITLAEYDAIFVLQGGRCAICKESCPTQRELAVDHDHVTGEVRGLLCTQCNNGLGRFKESPALLRKAADYLDAVKADVTVVRLEARRQASAFIEEKLAELLRKG
jgi:hypothetical protein